MTHNYYPDLSENNLASRPGFQYCLCNAMRFSLREGDGTGGSSIVGRLEFIWRNSCAMRVILWLCAYLTLTPFLAYYYYLKSLRLKDYYYKLLKLLNIMFQSNTWLRLKELIVIISSLWNLGQCVCCHKLYFK